MLLAHQQMELEPKLSLGCTPALLYTHPAIHVLSLSRMTNYALSLLVIFNLQQLERPILYPLHTRIQHYQVL